MLGLSLILSARRIGQPITCQSSVEWQVLGAWRSLLRARLRLAKYIVTSRINTRSSDNWDKRGAPTIFLPL